MAKAEDPARGANIFDVARLAGVSHMTVSRVVNDSPSVRPETRERVKLAIKQLRYQPSPAARALVTRRTRTIGLVTAGSTDYGPSSIQAQFNAAASEAQYAVLTASAVGPTFATTRTAVESLLRQNVEAIVLVQLDVGTLENLSVMELGIPVVPVASGPGRGPLAVSVDQYGGARAAVAHPLAAGYRDIPHLAGPAGHPDAVERLRGWADALADAGLPRGMLHQGDWSAGSGHRIGLELALRAGETGVFVGNDQMALGLMSAMEQRGLRIPEALGVIGFDDVPESAYYSPPLTTIRQDFVALGRLALQRVLAALDDATDATPAAPLTTSLIIRSSTAPLPRSQHGEVGDESRVPLAVNAPR
jgi:DNA-binding LacI/PurR family transcriptional regulator